MRVDAPTDTASLAQLSQLHPRLALYVTQPDCGPCKALWPQVASRFGDDDAWALARIDVTETPELRGQLLLFAVPALVLFVEGREFDRAARVVPQAWLHGIKQRIDELLG